MNWTGRRRTCVQVTVMFPPPPKGTCLTSPNRWPPVGAVSSAENTHFPGQRVLIWVAVVRRLPQGGGRASRNYPSVHPPFSRVGTDTCFGNGGRSAWRKGILAISAAPPPAGAAPSPSALISQTSESPRPPETDQARSPSRRGSELRSGTPGGMSHCSFGTSGELGGMDICSRKRALPPSRADSH